MEKVSSRIFLTAFLSLIILQANGQSCCKKPAGIRALALATTFKAAPGAPSPVNYGPGKGGMMQFTVTDGHDGNAFFVPTDTPTDKVLIIFHEWWGLNDYIKKEAEQLQYLLGGKVNVYAVDLFDGQVAVTPDEAGKLSNSLNLTRAEAIVKGLITKIGQGKKIATLGWSMGGTWSFTGSVFAGNSSAGCVMYYGFPDKDVKHIKALKCDVLYIRGSKDNLIKESDVKDFETKVKVSGHGFNLCSFDAVHAFANPGNPGYDAVAAAEAQKLSVAFLKEKLGL